MNAKVTSALLCEGFSLIAMASELEILRITGVSAPVKLETQEKLLEGIMKLWLVRADLR